MCMTWSRHCSIDSSESAGRRDWIFVDMKVGSTRSLGILYCKHLSASPAILQMIQGVTLVDLW